MVVRFSLARVCAPLLDEDTGTFAAKDHIQQAVGTGRQIASQWQGYELARPGVVTKLVIENLGGWAVILVRRNGRTGICDDFARTTARFSIPGERR